MTVNRANLQLWLDDLRTTTEPQCGGALHRTISGEAGAAGYCCLGRLCEVAIAHGVPVKKERFSDAYDSYDGQDSFPPASVYAWLGLIEDVDNIKGTTVAEDGGPYQVNEVSVLNDMEGLTFAEIADAVEAYYKEDE